MEVLKLNVRIREAKGRGSSRRLRKAGEIPAVVYGRSGTNPLAINQKDFSALWRSLDGGASLIEISDDQGNTRLTTVKDMQMDPIKDTILHIDFGEVYEGETMSATIQLHTTGKPKGVVDDGGILEITLHELEIECFPRNLPDFLEVDVSALEIGDSVQVSDIQLPEGVEIMEDDDTVVATVAAPISEEELEAAETIDPADVALVGEEEEEGEEGEGSEGEDSGEESEEGESKEKSE